MGEQSNIPQQFKVKMVLANIFRILDLAETSDQIGKRYTSSKNRSALI